MINVINISQVAGSLNAQGLTFVQAEDMLNSCCALSTEYLSWNKTDSETHPLDLLLRSWKLITSKSLLSRTYCDHLKPEPSGTHFLLILLCGRLFSQVDDVLVLFPTINCPPPCPENVITLIVRRSYFVLFPILFPVPSTGHTQIF